MPKQNRQPGIHLHKTQRRTGSIKSEKANKDIYQTEWYWILIAKNGKTIARSFKTHRTKRSAVRSIEVAAEMFLGGKPYELIPYYDHTLPGLPVKYC